MQSDFQRLRRLIAMLESTPTGLGLLNGSVVLPITDAARTDTAGVPLGALNVYRSGTSRFLQVFDQQGTGSPAWVAVEMIP